MKRTTKHPCCLISFASPFKERKRITLAKQMGVSLSSCATKHQLINVREFEFKWRWFNRKPTTGRQSPSLIDKWHGIFYMPSRIDEAGHTKAFDYPVAVHWGESRNVQFRGWDSNRQHISPESNALPTEPPRLLC